ncbi:MAG: hypothetical protein HYW78_02865 [Parcubacteria group bacterium]|nr:hypothetical protein [Parcubacteria group bacterium]
MKTKKEIEQIHEEFNAVYLFAEPYSQYVSGTEITSTNGIAVILKKKLPKDIPIPTVYKGISVYIRKQHATFIHP